MPRRRSSKAAGKLALAAAMVVLAGCATGAPQTLAPDPMRTVGAALPPTGFLDFCARQPSDCFEPDMAEPAAIRATALQLRDDLGGARPAAARAPATVSAWNASSWQGLFRGAGEVHQRAALPRRHPAPPKMTAALWATLNQVNDEANQRIISRSDQKTFGMSDYWTTPLAEAPRAYGDCEDYVLQKKRWLIEAGLPPTALSIAIVKAGPDNTHAVLLVETGGGEYVLDSLTNWILPWTETPYRWLERQVAGSAFVWASGPPQGPGPALPKS